MDTQALAAELSRAATYLADGGNVDQTQWEELSAACEAVLQCLKTPSQRLDELSYRWPEMAATKTAIDMGLFDVVANSDKTDFTAGDIASELGADAVLVERILRALKVIGLFAITDNNTYKTDPCIKDFADGGYMRDQVSFIYDVHYLVYPKLPAFLAKSRYQCPDDAVSGPFQYAINSNDHLFTWLKNHPEQQTSFNKFMKASGQKRQTMRWPEIFPVANRFHHGRGLCADRPLFQFVDIGGGVGHDLHYLINKVPELEGAFFLQDTPDALCIMLEELRSTSKTQEVTPMPYNFFEPQPVKGADVYFLGRVLHDWPTKQSQQILMNITDAMGPHSTLLIHDRVLPVSIKEVFASDVSLDFIMMTMFAASERSETQFRELLESVGLELKRVWRPESKIQNRQAILEVVKRKEVE